jgi:2-polyprenyl-3-methyl-5-hydroxy-6-metoxy-1,4-benzoquinol methylase
VATVTAVGAHDPFYFGHARPEVLELIPRSARRILDIGCGAGRLGAALKARQPAEVTGIELDEAAATAARQHLDQVCAGDVERLEPDFAEGSFDAIVCGDVLEHLREPERLLQRARAWLAPEGRLIASIPNVRHHSVIRSLLEGNWTYESAGLLDRTHLRFFTRREIEKLFARAGLAIDELRWVAGPGEDGAERRRGAVHLGRLRIDGVADAEADEFLAYQFLVVGRRAETPEFGLTSIVIVTYNQLDYTHLCLDSLRLRTDEPYELIVVDNASTDGTVEYLRALPDVRLILNPTNRGFPAAVNQGIAAARGARSCSSTMTPSPRRAGSAGSCGPCTRIRRSGWPGRAPTVSAARSRSRPGTTAWPTWTVSPGIEASCTTASASRSTGWSGSAC